MVRVCFLELKRATQEGGSQEIIWPTLPTLPVAANGIPGISVSIFTPVPKLSEVWCLKLRPAIVTESSRGLVVTTMTSLSYLLCLGWAPPTASLSFCTPASHSISLPFHPMFLHIQIHSNQRAWPISLGTCIFFFLFAQNAC